MTFDHRKYKPYPRIDEARPPLARARARPRRPIWCAVDLRDGNQALVEADVGRPEALMFKLLVDVGFKEIEVGFPAASQPDFDFVREIIEQGLIPDDVTIQVLTQARPELIARTFEALRGAKRAIVHLYNSTSTCSASTCSSSIATGIKQIAVDGAKWVKEHAAAAARDRVGVPVLAGELHRHRARLRGRGLRRGERVWQPHKRPEGHHQPAGDGGDEHAQRLRRPDRVDVRPHAASRALPRSACTRTTIAAAASPPSELGVLAGADRVEGTLARQRRAHRQHRHRHDGA